jgi:mRNA interferase RelE/StbE
MKYRVTIQPSALRDLKEIPRNFADSILRKIERLEDGLPGSVKPLANLEYGYRLRLGDYRILFDVEGDLLTIERVLHRKHAYTSREGKRGQH